MFNAKHYIPILKWKRAEQGALGALTGEQKKHITPLIQFVMPKPKHNEQLKDIVLKFEKQLSQIPEKIIKVWGNTPIFIDASLLFTIALKGKTLDIVLRGGHELGGVFIPVIHLNDEEEIQRSVWSAVKETQSGLCVRLIRPDFSNTTKRDQDMASILSSSSLSKKDIDLLVDIKVTEDLGEYAEYFNLSQNMSDLSEWRTFIFASGSFPKDLSACKLDEENLIPRIDWKGWQEQVSSKKIQRKPTFADYTIQHPIYTETSQFFHPTTSIKYTLENEWLIMKGKKKEFGMYLANAALLVTDKRFSGENFSEGDQYIAEKAKHCETYMKNSAIGGTGNTATWISAGINHHLAIVANQISTLT